MIVSLLRRSLLPFTAFLLTAVLLVPDVGAQDRPDVTGTWQDTLSVQGMQLRLVFHIEEKDDSLTATMDSPDQGAQGIPTSRLRVTDDSLTIEVASIAGQFNGKIQTSGTQIEGTWSQGGRSFPLTLERTSATAEVEAPDRPQEPEPPFPYTTTDVSFRNVQDDVTLAGTLTIPEGEGPHPGVVLVSGSGPQNRNAEVMGHKLFLVLADYLTRQGIAVLRFDERGVGASTGSRDSLTTETLARDVEAAADLLASRPEVDRDRVGIYGHSEGGWIAPMVANRFDEVDFLVLVAPAGVSGGDIVVEQTVRMAEVQGAQPSALDSIRSFRSRLMGAVTQEADSATIARRIQRIVKTAGGASSTAQSLVQAYTSPWFRYFATHDPAPMYRKVDEPVLVLFGGKDLQVTPAQNLEPVRSALQASDSPSVTVRELEGLNHLMQPADTGLPGEYRQIETTMDPEALETVASWIRDRGAEK